MGSVQTISTSPPPTQTYYPPGLLLSVKIKARAIFAEKKSFTEIVQLNARIRPLGDEFHKNNFVKILTILSLKLSLAS